MTLFYYHWNIMCFVGVTLTFPYWFFPLSIQGMLTSLLVFVATYYFRLVFLFWLRGFLLALFFVSLHSYLFGLKVDNAFYSNNDITISAHIDSFLKKIRYGNEYLLKLESINGDVLPFFAQPRVVLTTPNDIKFELGEKWYFAVKVKPVFGRLNEAGFDLERFYISQGWHGKASFIATQEPRLIEESNSLRLLLYQKVEEHIESLSNKALLRALSFGDRNDLSLETWDELKASGLIHLVAISGLHIGIAFLFGWKLGKVCRLFINQWLSAPLIFAVFCAVAYSWLAGFSIPTIRALVMCTLLGLFTYIRLQYSPWQILLFTMAILLIFDPFAILSSSFWMSFLAVAAIYLLLKSPFIQSVGRFKQLVLMQLGLTVVMLPVTAYYFSGFSMTSFVYNFAFVPWFSFIIVPLVFISLAFSMIAPSVAEKLWLFADLLISPVSWSIQFSLISWINVDKQIVFILFLLLLCIIVKPLVSSKLYALSLVILVLIVSSLEVEERKLWQLSILDVGHGLAILINKEEKHILYDTGNVWEGGSIAESVIEPVLKGRGVDSLDALILSHLDSDHAGGRSYIESLFDPKYKLSSQFILGYHPCIEHEVWDWNGLNFEVVWPPRLSKRAYNPNSCVIRITDGTSSVLLTGDIEAISELLIARNNKQIQSDILIVPHHGSLTSSTNYFLDAVNPSVALASLSLGNQWNFPSANVLKRYRERDIQWLDTGASGQISIEFSSNGWEIITQRNRQFLAWYRQKLRKGVE